MKKYSTLLFMYEDFINTNPDFPDFTQMDIHQMDVELEALIGSSSELVGPSNSLVNQILQIVKKQH